MHINEEHAFALSAFPCNPRPFLRRMEELWTASQDPTTGGDTWQQQITDFKACLWVVLGQTYGQLAKVPVEVTGELEPNVIAAIETMREVVNRDGAPAMRGFFFRACLNDVLIAAYGPVNRTISLSDEWDVLYRKLTPEVVAALY